MVKSWISLPFALATLTLLALNEEILSEILSFLLLDTRGELNRTSVLQTCSSLHRLGLPHLYGVVDLTGFDYKVIFMRQWTTLFGEGGILTVEGRDQEVGRMVKELRFGSDKSDSVRPRLNLPFCRSLILDLAGFRSPTYQALSVTAPQLPVRDFAIDLHYHPPPWGRPSITDRYLQPLDKAVPGLWPQPWDLRTLTFRNTIWYDQLQKPRWYKMLSLSKWTFQVLVVRFDEVGAYDEFEGSDGVGQIVELFLDVEVGEQGSFVSSAGRIEFRGGAPVEEEFRKVVAKREKVGLTEFEKRIASLIVFVDEDETERRLWEEVQN